MTIPLGFLKALMASSSSRSSCFQCKDSTSANFRNGWRLRNGNFAQLCHICASVYEAERFCETFHRRDDGWRDCESCGKLVHCGCIVSFDTYLLLDFGGIMCMECSKKNFILARNHCLSHESQVLTGESQLVPSGLVTFYRIEPGKKLAMGLRKSFAGSTAS